MPLQSPIILFDGVCNFCNASVNFIIRQDKKNRFYFAPLQSASAQQLLAQHGLFKKFDSFIFIRDGQLFQKSNAALKVIAYLPWYWQWANIFWIVPRFLRDAVYDFVARNRYRWFGKKEVCMVPTSNIASRFLQ